MDRFITLTMTRYQVGITAHPSHLQYPEDLEKLLAQSKAPILMCGAET